MTETRRSIPAWTMICLCWSLESLSFWQKVKWSVRFVKNAWRRKRGLEIKPMHIRIWD